MRSFYTTRGNKLRFLGHHIVISRKRQRLTPVLAEGARGNLRHASQDFSLSLETQTLRVWAGVTNQI